jgi:beta-lactamase class A
VTDPRSPGRRLLLRGLTLGAVALATRAYTGVAPEFASELSDLEHAIGGRIGLGALDLGSGRRLTHRADERFAMCSTFKLLLAAAILARVDAGTLRLDQEVTYGENDLLSNSPVTTRHASDGHLPVETLLEAVIEVSDNTSANLLLALDGGPRGVTRYCRSLGDHITRLDRTELALNSNLPADPRDTTTPRAMLGDLERILTGDALSSASRARLLGWLRACRTGQERLRAGLPPGWTAGDKTGTGDRGAVNDVAIFVPPGRKPLLIACYLSDSGQDTKALNTVHARIGAQVAAAFS